MNFHYHGFKCELPYNIRYAIAAFNAIRLLLFVKCLDDFDEVTKRISFLCERNVINHRVIKDVHLIMDVSKEGVIDISSWHTIDSMTTDVSMDKILRLSRLRGKYVLLQAR